MPSYYLLGSFSTGGSERNVAVGRKGRAQAESGFLNGLPGSRSAPSKQEVPPTRLKQSRESIATYADSKYREFEQPKSREKKSRCGCALAEVTLPSYIARTWFLGRSGIGMAHIPAA